MGEGETERGKEEKERGGERERGGRKRGGRKLAPKKTMKYFVDGKVRRATEREREREERI
jgi:hypothetical protein